MRDLRGSAVLSNGWVNSQCEEDRTEGVPQHLTLPSEQEHFLKVELHHIETEDVVDG